MAREPLIWVRAKSRGQTPDRRWHDPSSPPFQVPESLVSARWMVRLPPEPTRAKAKQQAEEAS